MGWLLYWWQVVGLTKERIKDHWRAILMGYLCLPVADVFLYFYFGRSKASQAFQSMTLTQLIPFTLGGIFLTVFYMFVVAPYRMHQKTSEESDGRQSKIESLLEDIRQFEDRSSPKLEFIISDRPPHKECMSPVGGMWKFRVEVKNVWHEMLTDCTVTLDSISPGNERFIPRRLKIASDNPPDTLNIGHKQSFQVKADDTELIDIILVDMRPGAKFRLFYATDGTRDFQTDLSLPQGNYIFGLKAAAHLGKSIRESFVLEVNHAKPKFFRLTTTPIPDIQGSSIPAT